MRALAQSGLQPSNCRLLDEAEALVSGSGDGSRAVLLVGFESADHPLDAWLARAVEICREQGGEVEVRAPREGAAGAWRQAFIRGPHVRDALVRLGLIAETFETAVTWYDRERPPLFADALRAAKAALDPAGILNPGVLLDPVR